MEMYHGLDALPETPLEPVLTMGNFDGVHRGHQAILGRLGQEAQRLGVPTMVLTFYPHPRQILRPDDPFVPIMSLKERMRRFWDLGIDHALVIPFDLDMAEMTAQEFIEEILWDTLRISGIYVGPFTTFGHKRGGDVKLLESWGRRLGYAVGVVDPVVVEGRRVSSSRIRRAIAQGQLTLAAKMLGRHHRLAGVVVQGDQRGRELGFPTANITYDGALLPPFGVYAAWAILPDQRRVGAVVNIGVRPTFEGQSFQIEAHLLDFDEDLYSQEIILGLVEGIRPETRFENVQLLKRQIKRDVIEARRLLGLLKGK